MKFCGITGMCWS